LISNISSRVPIKEALCTEPLQVPGSPAAPLWKKMPLFRAFSTYPPEFLAREPYLHVPFTELP